MECVFVAVYELANEYFKFGISVSLATMKHRDIIINNNNNKKYKNCLASTPESSLMTYIFFLFTFFLNDSCASANASDIYD